MFAPTCTYDAAKIHLTVFPRELGHSTGSALLWVGDYSLGLSFLLSPQLVLSLLAEFPRWHGGGEAK